MRGRLHRGLPSGAVHFVASWAHGMLAGSTGDMNWLFELHATQPVAQAIGILALVCVVGMAIGSIKVRGIGLGTAGVLFAGTLSPC